MADNWTTLKSWDVIFVEKLDDSKVARLVLNRPDKRNAMSKQLMENFLEALEFIRDEDSINVVVTKGAGPVWCAGQDLFGLQELHNKPLGDWDRPQLSTRFYTAVRTFPKVMIAQIHGFALGGAVALLTSHDIVIAADDAQIGMPEILRGSFGMNVTANLFHSGLPFKKLSLLQLGGRNITGAEADDIGIVSKAVPADELEEYTTQLAREIGSRHPEALRHGKAAVELGRDVGLAQAMEVDRLLTTRMRTAVDPLVDLDTYLDSQRGGTNGGYVRADQKS